MLNALSIGRRRELLRALFPNAVIGFLRGQMSAGNAENRQHRLRAVGFLGVFACLRVDFPRLSIFAPEILALGTAPGPGGAGEVQLRRQKSSGDLFAHTGACAGSVGTALRLQEARRAVT